MTVESCGELLTKPRYRLLFSCAHNEHNLILMRISHASERASLRSTRESLDGFTKDLAFVGRTLRRAPGFTLAVVATLALGLGVNAAVFSFLAQVFLVSPAGVSAPEQLRRVWIQHPAGGSGSLFTANQLSYHHYRQIAAELRGQATLAVYTLQPDLPVGDLGTTAKATTAYVSGNYFDVLGARPTLGRAFTEGEADVHGASSVAVVSQAFWRNRLGADPNALGRRILIGGRPFTLIGIAPPRFSGVDLQRTDVWLPLGTMPTREVPRVSFWESSIIFFSVFGRVTEGTNEWLLEERLTTAYRLSPTTDFPPSKQAQIYLRSIIDARGMGSRSQELSIGLRLSFIGALILLMAAANVINLLLARTVSRRREIGVRLALGIDRVRLFRLLLLESVVLSLIAGAVALMATQTTAGALRHLLLPGVDVAEGGVPLPVVLFAIGLSLIVGLLVGLIPALRTGRADLTLALRNSTRGPSGRVVLPQILVGFQAALSVALMVDASLVVGSLRNVNELDTGFDIPRLAFASVNLPAGIDTAGFATVMRQAGQRVERVPGVEAVGFSRDEPMTWFGRVTFYTATDSSDSPDRPVPTASYVSAAFFKAIGTPFVRGSSFSDDSPSSSATVVVNQTLARMFWPAQEAIGQCIYIQQRNSPCLTVTGVVEDAIRQRLIEAPTPQLYLPIFQSVRGQRPPKVMVIRAEPAHLEQAMAYATRVLHEAFPSGEPAAVRMADRLASQYRPWELGAALFSGFGLLALVIAALGIYSSVSYSTSQRRHEIGVRIALGANMHDVLRHVVGNAVRPVGIGGLVGAVLAVASSRLLVSLLYGVRATNPLITVAVMVVILFVAAAAAWIPGWRATRIDPTRSVAAT